jgi:geranylgeranyl reductase
MGLRTQVLVIGGGPAGSSAARFLAMQGIDTILLERDFSFVKPCGGGMPSTVIVERGIPDYLVKKHVHGVKLVSPGGESIPITLRGSSIAIVQRGDFDRVLRNEAEKSGAMLLPGEFRYFVDAGRTITAEVNMDGEYTRIEADSVIAADGVNSRVRAALKIKPSPSFLTLSEKIREEDADVCEFWFGSSHAPYCYSWVFPQQEGITAGTGVFQRSGIREFWQTFVKRRGLPTTGSVRGYKVPLWQGDLYQSGRVLFAGDAAGQVMPITYEGIFYAMKSGEMAAMAIASGKMGDYKKLWEKSFRRQFVFMKGLWKYFMKNDTRIEKMLQLYTKPEVQEASMRFWFERGSRGRRFSPYLKVFRSFLG